MGLSREEIKERNRKIMNALKNGGKVSDIARTFHITRARVYQIIYAAST